MEFLFQQTHKCVVFLVFPKLLNFFLLKLNVQIIITTSVFEMSTSRDTKTTHTDTYSHANNNQSIPNLPGLSGLNSTTAR